MPPPPNAPEASRGPATAAVRPRPSGEATAAAQPPPPPTAAVQPGAQGRPTASTNGDRERPPPALPAAATAAAAPTPPPAAVAAAAIIRTPRFMVEGVGARVIRGIDWKWGKQVILRTFKS